MKNTRWEASGLNENLAEMLGFLLSTDTPFLCLTVIGTRYRIYMEGGRYRVKKVYSGNEAHLRILSPVSLIKR